MDGRTEWQCHSLSCSSQLKNITYWLHWTNWYSENFSLVQIRISGPLPRSDGLKIIPPCRICLVSLHISKLIQILDITRTTMQEYRSLDWQLFIWDPFKIGPNISEVIGFNIYKMKIEGTSPSPRGVAKQYPDQQVLWMTQQKSLNALVFCLKF